MPNWVYNTVTFQHANSDTIAEVTKAFRENRLLSYLFPEPTRVTRQPPATDVIFDDHPARKALDWRYDNWGTKWDVGIKGKKYFGKEGNGCVRELSERSVTVEFISANDAPIGAYRAANKTLGFSVSSEYMIEFGGLDGNGKFCVGADGEISDFYWTDLDSGERIDVEFDFKLDHRETEGAVNERLS